MKKSVRYILASILLGGSSLCLAGQITTTITNLAIFSGDANSQTPDPTLKPYVTFSMPIGPADCWWQFKLTDLTDPAQKQMYATLVTAKINGLKPKLTYQTDNAAFICRVVGVEI